MHEEELERTEDSKSQSEIRNCRSRLARTRKDLIIAVQHKAASSQSLHLWQRIAQGAAGQALGTLAALEQDGETKAEADAHIKRLKSDNLRNTLDIRGLQVSLVVSMLLQQEI